MGESEKKRRNLIVNGVKEVNEEEGGLKKRIEQIIKGLGVKVTIGGLKKLDAGRKEWGSMILVEVGSEKERRKVLENKDKLKSGEIWIEKHLPWRERRVKWILKLK